MGVSGARVYMREKFKCTFGCLNSLFFAVDIVENLRRMDVEAID